MSPPPSGSPRPTSLRAVEAVVSGYTPHWGALADALKRVMATGSSEDEAKTDLCRAMADRKIGVRVRIAASDLGMRGQVFSRGNVEVPPHLGPGDLDWVQSRPLKRWSIGPMPGQHYSWIGGWKDRPIDFIELSTADVAEIFPSAEGATKTAATAAKETAAIKALASHLESNPNLKRADAADWCRERGHQLGKRAFERVWPEARSRAGLDRNAPAGRKPNRPAKSSR